MSQIRKQSMKGTVWIYLGFVFGLFNQYFLTKNGWFTVEENGLRNVMLELSGFISAFASVGTTTYLFKFFPYYKKHTSPQSNDMLGLALKVALVGFLVTLALIYFGQPLIVRKFSTNSPLLVQYFMWVVPLGFFQLIYTILDAYALGFHRGVLTNFLKDTLIKIYTFVLVVLKVSNVIDFHTFVVALAFQYALITFILLYILHSSGQLWLSFKKSIVTHKFRKKIILLLSFTFFVVVVNALRTTIDGLVLASKTEKGLGNVAVYGLVVFMTSVMMAPFRSIVSITLPVLSQAWHSKNIKEISKIYKRSSINLLTFGLFIFCTILLCFEPAIHIFGINPSYLEGKNVFILLGIVTLIEIGTGVNAQIIGTSSYWSFELWTSLLLTILIIPLSYFLTISLGIFGPAWANLISFSIYNLVRISFLWNKWRLQPFSIKTFEVIGIAAVGFAAAWYVQSLLTGLFALFVPPIIFLLVFGLLSYHRNVSPDLKPVVQTAVKRIKKLKT